MPRNEITPTDLVAAGVFTNAVVGDTSGEKFPNDGNTFILVTNDDAGSKNFTIQTPATQSGLAIAEQIVAVGAGATKLIGPFPVKTYNQSDGMVYVDYEDFLDSNITVYRML